MNNTWWRKPDDLDDKQRSVIDLPLNESHLIIGPPGSGKTNLLVLRASQMVRSGKPNVLVLVFTRTLREFLATGGTQYAFGVDKIQTLNNWASHFLRDQGVSPVRDADFDKQRRLQLAQITRVVTDQHLSRVYDAIVLDETQDYLAEEIDMLFRLGQVVFAGADSRQRIYVNGHTSYPDLLKRFGKNVFPLKYHYRNGTRICEVADELAKVWDDHDLLLPTSNYDERRYPSSVEIQCCPNIAGQVGTAVAPLTRQIKAYPKEYLGLLCLSRSTLNTVWREVQASPLSKLAILQSSQDGYVRFEEEKPICVCTIHGAKGLEFRTVHLFDTENITHSPLNRNIAYTAVTRAKTSLTIYHSNALPPYIDSALNIVRAPVRPAKLDQLFGGS